MKNILFVLLFSFVSGFSQDFFEVKSVKTLVVPSGQVSIFMSPRWSPDGTKIAFTSANYKGIWVYELQTEQLNQITDEMASGFGFSWSVNSNAILARVSRFENNRRLSAVKLFFLDQQEPVYLTEYRRRLPDVPQWTPGNSRVYFYNGREMEYLDTPLEKISGSSPFICYTISDRIFLENTETGEKNRFQPFPGAIYLNVKLSPDQRNVVFEVYGGNLHVLNLESGKVTDLGTGNHPAWSPDGKYIVYMIARDDGYRYTSSDIVVTDTERNFFQNLTSDFDQIAMYPSWSPLNDGIVFSTYDLGTIEMIEFGQ